ncbi:hypothetical protein BASA81_011013 [Batrachochytrium salamandrivorans]|nr:hypothetical protein BASA81_011013 [Batrachochytrium salamandrivorans]
MTDHQSPFLEFELQDDRDPPQENGEEDDDDAATVDSLDGLVASVVGDSLGDFEFHLDSVRPTSAPLPPLTGVSSSAAAAASGMQSWMLDDALGHLSLSSPTSPSAGSLSSATANATTSSRLRTFDFASAPQLPPLPPNNPAASPRFMPSAPSPSHQTSSTNMFGRGGQYAMFTPSSTASSNNNNNSASLEEQQLQKQIEELQQKLHWQQQQQQQQQQQRHDWGTYQPATPLYPPAYAGGYNAPSSPSSASSSLAIDKLLVSDAPLETMEGRFLQLAQEQNGCRYLQSRIAKEGSMGAHLVLREVFVHLVDLMTDPFANYMYQKLLDVASPEQRLAMLEQVRHSLLPASLNLHGTRSVQKHIEVASLNSKQERQRQIISQELSMHVTRLSMDTNGNHVIQRMLQHFHPSDCEFIFRAVVQDLILVTRHRHGCCVVQRSLDASVGPTRDRLIDIIEYHCLQLMQDPFANYTVQYVLDRGLGERIVNQVLGKIESLSKQKFSSNVVEKCILAANPAQLEEICQECERCMGSLLRDAYANFVAQKLLEVTTEPQSRRLVATMRPHLLELNLSCSRRVVNRVVKRFPDLVGDDIIQQVLSGGGGTASPPPQQQQQQQHYGHHHHQPFRRNNHHHHQQQREL